LRKNKLTAKTSDIHDLYELSVQCVEAEIDFVLDIFKKRGKKAPRSVKEDFCGTASACAEFVQRHRDNFAVGVDLDTDTLDWGREHRLAPLGQDMNRVKLLNKNVLSVTRPKVDAVMAFNFSYFIFKERKTLLKYFKTARASLNSGGMLFLDAYGGSDSQVVLEEERKLKGFTYVWDQAEFNPINNEVINHIHFRFRDGTSIEKAFSYDWRLWSLREITELLAEAGFARSDVYWEGWDGEAEEGNGVFKPSQKEENCPGWIAYVVAER